MWGDDKRIFLALENLAATTRGPRLSAVIVRLPGLTERGTVCKTFSMTSEFRLKTLEPLEELLEVSYI